MSNPVDVPRLLRTFNKDIRNAVSFHRNELNDYAVKMMKESEELIGHKDKQPIHCMTDWVTVLVHSKEIEKYFKDY